MPLVDVLGVEGVAVGWPIGETVPVGIIGLEVSVGFSVGVADGTNKLHRPFWQILPEGQEPVCQLPATQT